MIPVWPNLRCCAMFCPHPLALSPQPAEVLRVLVWPLPSRPIKRQVNGDLRPVQWFSLIEASFASTSSTKWRTWTARPSTKSWNRVAWPSRRQEFMPDWTPDALFWPRPIQSMEDMIRTSRPWRILDFRYALFYENVASMDGVGKRNEFDGGI